MESVSYDFDSVSPSLWIANEETWKEKLLNLTKWNQIPLLNSNALHNLPDGRLVRFRGMVQDMHDREFYFEKFEVYNTITNEIKVKSGKYCDTAHILENEKINYTENLKCAQRQAMVVVSLPGLSEWVQVMEDNENHLTHLENLSNTSKQLCSMNISFKRSRDESVEDPQAMDDVEVVNKNKQLKSKEIVDTVNNGVSREHYLNFPLPDVPGKSCIVKMYDESDSIKLNDMIEVVGFLSVDPSLSGEFLPEKSQSSFLEPVVENDVETITHNPPPSLIPRLHAVYVKKLDHCNPLLKDKFNQATVLQEANSVREQLLKALTELLLGDQLAAEYLICHLIASVYSRQDTLVLGTFCLNISILPTKKYPNYAKQLYDIIKQFVTKSYYLPITIDNLNTMTLLPKKDYECNRLTSGILQLSKYTHLILDETKLERGKLNHMGVSNINALKNMITTQKVEYDFKYYKMEFDSDIQVLLLSEGKSLFPSDYHVPLRPEESSLEIFDAIVEAATYYLKEELMNTIRKYLTNLKFVEYTISEDSQFVSNDFAEMRSKSNPENPYTADDLHRLLTLARLVSLSRGHDTLNKECWDIARKMETERLERLKNGVIPTL